MSCFLTCGMNPKRKEAVRRLRLAIHGTMLVFDDDYKIEPHPVLAVLLKELPSYDWCLPALDPPRVTLSSDGQQDEW